jgi:divalent metal cation (Fe/Co/Zn/Cd) transporter
MGVHQCGVPDDPQSVRAALVLRGLRLEYVTLAWVLLEAAVAVAAGILAGSIALVGFGLDSLVEMSSGAILVWRLASDRREEERERIEARALRMVGASLLAVAAYVLIEAVRALILRRGAEVSLVGMAVAAAALIVMPLLARAKRRVAAQIDSRALVADSRQADICAWLSCIVLVGLILNAAFGWWWSDPVAALLIVPIVVKEGVEALRGDRC